MVKYTTINKYNGKRTRQTTTDMELAIDRCEKGGYVVVNLSDRKLLVFDRRR